MVEAYDFENNYGSDPWGENITLDERPWYDPILRDHYTRQSVYSQHAMYNVDMNGPKARTIYFNDLIPPRPNTAEMTPRGMEATRLYTDSYQREVTTARYGNGVGFHEETKMFQYWQRNGGGTGPGLMGIIQGGLSQALTDHIDLLAQRAYFLHPYASYGTGSGTGVADIVDGDKLSTDVIDSVTLGMSDRPMPFQGIPQPFQHGSELLCITTPGAIYDLRREVGAGQGSLNFVDINKYTPEGRSMLMAGEIGTYRGVRFIGNLMAKLWNHGTPTVQTAIVSSVQPGDGAPDPATTLVEGVRRVGQPSSKHYIEVTSAAGIVANDTITIHKVRATAPDLLLSKYAGKAVLNGVLYDDPMMQHIEVHSVDTTTTPDRIYLKEPYMMVSGAGKGLEVDLGSSTFGYVTKGRTVHSTLFLNPQQKGLICGVARPPKFYAPRPIDDYESMYRLN